MHIQEQKHLLHIIKPDGHWQEKTSFWWNWPATDAALLKHLYGLKWAHVIDHDGVHFPKHPLFSRPSGASDGAMPV